MFCFPWWASPTERVFVFLFVSLHLLWCAPAPFLRLRLLTLGCSEFALRASRVFSYVRTLLWYISLLQLCLVGRWVGLVGCTRLLVSWQGDSRDTYIDLWHHECWLDPLQRLGRSPQVVSATAQTAASATPVTAQLLFAIRARHVVVFFTCVARHGRNICDTFSDLCQSRFTRFGPVYFCLGTPKTTTPHCVTTPGALVTKVCPWHQSGRPPSHWLYLISHPWTVLFTRSYWRVPALRVVPLDLACSCWRLTQDAPGSPAGDSVRWLVIWGYFLYCPRGSTLVWSSLRLLDWEVT